MAMTKMINGQEIDDRFLDLKNPNFDLSVTSIAYMVSSKQEYTKTEPPRPYVRFNLRDVNGTYIPGWLFDSDRFENLAEVLAITARSPVEITYKLTNPVNGSIQLYVHNVKRCKEEHFPYDKFLGKVEDCEEMFDICNKWISDKLGEGYRMSATLKLEPFLSICDGRVGGYSHFMFAVLRNMVAFSNGVDVSGESLALVCYKSLELYAEYLRLVDRVQVPLKHMLTNMVSDAVQYGVEEKDKDMVMDALYALVGIGKPGHLYAHLVVNSMNSAKANLDMIYSYPSMVLGSSKKVGEELWLLKY